MLFSYQQIAFFDFCCKVNNKTISRLSIWKIQSHIFVDKMNRATPRLEVIASFMLAISGTFLLAKALIAALMQTKNAHRIASNVF